VPVFVPFFFHWYDGEVPPLLAAAVKVTLVPAQIAEEDVEILILVDKLELTVIVMVLDEAGLPLLHSAFDVITQVTAVLFDNELFEYVAVLAPTLLPFSFHW
jgi:hypothetical protein